MPYSGYLMISNPNVPKVRRGSGNTLIITWNSNNVTPVTYEIARSINGGIFGGQGITYRLNRSDRKMHVDEIGDDWNTVSYKVREYKDGKMSGFSQASTTFTIRPVYRNSAPTISGQDGVIGDFVKGFEKEYSVDDEDLNQKLTVTVTLNGDQLEIISNAERNRLYKVVISDEKFNTLPLRDRNTIEIKVSDGEGGVAYRRWYFYRVNSSPIVTPENDDLGTFGHETNDGPTFAFKAVDPDGDRMTAKIFLDNKEIADLGEIEADTRIEHKIDTMTYRKLKNGVHTIKIEVMDDKKGLYGSEEEVTDGAVGLAYIRFEKKVTKAFYYLKAETDDIVKSVVILRPAMDLAEGATLKVTVCNNPFDPDPKWEEVTEENWGKYYDFINKNSINKGIEIRYDFDRGTANKDSYVYGLVGRYEFAQVI